MSKLGTLHAWRVLIGMTNPISRTRRIWAGMRRRCNSPKEPSYRRYGGRGIKVCPEWANFEQFLADMGPAPAGLTLDRENNDKGYSKDNCRWATALEQCRNKSDNRKITIAGETLCLSEWAHRNGLTAAIVYKRMRDGWPLLFALFHPKQRPGHSISRIGLI